MDFLVDQRKCDLFALLATALDTFERAKESNGFIIKNINSIKDGNVVTIQLDFEEKIGNPKK